MYGTRRRRDPKTRPGFFLNRWALRRADLAVFNNRRDQPALARVVSSTRLAYLAPGIFPEMFSRDDAGGRAVRRRYGISDDDWVVLTVARFRPGVKWESLHFLFQALVQLREVDVPWRLMVVGDGPLEAKVRRAAAASVGGRVVFAGRVAREDLAPCYSAADLFAFPGIGESLGMVYLEAQACGLPVVALRDGGVDQVVADAVTGVLIPNREPALYGEAILRLLRDEPRRQHMGREAERFVRRYRNFHVQARYLAGLLEWLVNRASGKFFS